MVIYGDDWWDDWWGDWARIYYIECWWWQPNYLVIYPNGSVNVGDYPRSIYDFDNGSLFTHTWPGLYCYGDKAFERRLADDIAEFVAVAHT